MDKERQQDGSRLDKTREYQVYGKYLDHTKRVFTAREILQIRVSIMKGTRVSRIAERYGVDRKVIGHLFKEFVRNPKRMETCITPDRLGHKDEPYYHTEEEMLERPSYSWEELSTVEKEWYLQRKGQPVLLGNNKS
jgi:hypothetical protein